MPEPDTEELRHDPLAALRQRSFQLYSSSRIFATLAQQLLQAVMAWQVYAISGSALSLAFLGLARFFPALGASLVGGLVADTMDRRKVVIACQTVPFGCGAILAVATAGGWVSLDLIYGLVVLLGLASAFEAPARTALLPAIVKFETFANAVNVNNIFNKIGSVSGPTLAGFIIGAGGIASAYAAFCVTLVVAVLPMFFIQYRLAPAESRPRVTLDSIKEGIGFVRHRQVLLGAMTIDMFAVIFGGAAALLPVYAKDILHTGPTGYGLLSSSLQAGSFISAFLLVWRKPTKRTGRALIVTICIYAVFTMLFGLSRSFPLSLLLYGCLGAADQISVLMRQTTIQMATPDALRGRVSAVNQVFVQASNQIGAMESGFVAALTSATFSVVSGGAGALIIALLIGWRLPQLWNYVLHRAEEDETPAVVVPPVAAIDAQSPTSMASEAIELSGAAPKADESLGSEASVAGGA